MLRKFLKYHIKRSNPLKQLRYFTEKKGNNKEIEKLDTYEIDGKEYKIKEEPKRFGKSYEEHVKELEEKKLLIEKSALESQNIDPTIPFQVQPRKKLDRDPKLDIAQFQIQRPEDFYDHNLSKRPPGVFDFAAPKLIEKNGALMIDGVTEDGFQVGGAMFENPVIIFRKQIFFWDVHAPEDIRSHNFEIINLIKPRPGN